MAKKGLQRSRYFCSGYFITLFLEKELQWVERNLFSKIERFQVKKVHIERIIGLWKSYKILTNPLNSSTETKISSHIKFCPYMMCGFRPSFVSRCVETLYFNNWITWNNLSGDEAKCWKSSDTTSPQVLTLSPVSFMFLFKAILSCFIPCSK